MRARKPSQPLIQISQAQALLILIDKYHADPAKYQELSRLYLSGANNPSNLARISAYMQDEALQEYWISRSPQSIDSDPSRRYFETHLAHQTLVATLPMLEATSLDQYLKLLDGSLPEDAQYYVHITRDLIDEPIFDAQAPVYDEYKDIYRRFKADTIFSDFPPEQKQLLERLVAISLTSTAAAMHPGGAPLPLDIYQQGYFSAPNKGKQSKPNQELVRSNHFGLMKGHMAVPADDVAHTDTPFAILKASDKSSYDPQAQWVRDSFDHLVHPYSNSISGTVLCQLRHFKRLLNDGTLNFKSSDEIKTFFKCFISTMLFATGGHSLHEYCSTLMLPEVKAELSSIPFFDAANEVSLFLQDNSTAFDAAMEKAISYNQSLLKKQSLCAEVRSTQKTAEEESQTPLLIKQVTDIHKVLTGNLSEKNKKIFSNLIVPIEKMILFLEKNPSSIAQEVKSELEPYFREAGSMLTAWGKSERSRFCLFADTKAVVATERTFEQTKHMLDSISASPAHAAATP